MPLFPPERHRRILTFLEAQGTVNSTELEKELKVTAMTVWRDLKLLEERGQLKRMRGGAVRLSGPVEIDFHEKAIHAPAAKQRIAAYVASKLLKAGDSLILDGGTTIASLADQPLPARLTILTNSLPIAEAMQHHRARPSVYLSGGLLRPESGTLVGREAVTFFSRRRAIKFLMSATGLDAEAGVSDPNPQEIEVKQAMASRAQEVILMADASKLGVVSLMQTLPWRRIDRLVTDAPHKDPRLQRTLTQKRICSV
jgi:DeoR/GlpR family transcriptional regulator of sugar metabolism